ncbi:hypothetical protein AMECASPLE_031252 [Ameca splendens]|uniref:Uncharacterized protein n=1 Tax=Ameca splendens TaxID=208324 RepID=A0ABV0ZTY0_9TELE
MMVHPGLKEDRVDGQVVKLSKLNGVTKTEDEEERREMITPALREALSKQESSRILVPLLYGSHFLSPQSLYRI